MSCPEPPKVLVIDDNEGIAQLMGAFLDAAGFRTLVATDAAAGFDLARAQRPNVVVCDSMMPRMTGREFHAAMRQDPLLRQVPFILMSGAPDEHASTDSFLAKPFTIDEAVAAVNAALATVGRCCCGRLDSTLHAPAQSLPHPIETTIEAG